MIAPPLSWMVTVSWRSQTPSIEIHDPQRTLERRSLPAAPGTAESEQAMVIATGHVLARTSGVQSSSPADALVEAMVDQGRDPSSCFSSIDGAFATIIFDPTTGHVLAGRDPMGKQPLYYCADGDDLAFSANPLLLAEHHRPAAAIDRTSLTMGLIFSRPGIGQTAFEGIRRLPAGHVLTAGSSRATSIDRVWNPLDRAGDWVSSDGLIERYEELIEGTIADSLDWGATGILFSGGLDSVSVAAIAADLQAQASRPALIACCSRPPTPERWDYSTYAQDAVSEILGMPMISVAEGSSIPLEHQLRATIEIGDEAPLPNSVYWRASMRSFWQACAAGGARTVLTGSGGDEWFGIHHGYGSDLIRRGRFMALATYLRTVQASAGTDTRTAATDILHHSFGPLAKATIERTGLQGRLKRRAAQLPAWIGPEAQQLARGEREARQVSYLDERHRFPKSFYEHIDAQYWYGNPHQFHEFETGFHEQSIAGIFRISPFHSSSIIELTQRTRPEQHIQLGRNKSLLRIICDRRIPEANMNTQAKSYSSGPGEPIRALRAELADVYADIGCARSATLGLVDKREVEKAMKGLDDQPLRTVAQLFMVPATERWLATHG